MVRVDIVLGVCMIYARVGDARGHVIWYKDVVNASALVWSPSGDVWLVGVKVGYDRCVCVGLVSNALYEEVVRGWAACCAHGLYYRRRCVGLEVTY